MGLRLDKRALTEIVEILRSGLTEGTDISQALRDLDFSIADDREDTLRLSEEYLDRKRA